MAAVVAAVGKRFLVRELERAESTKRLLHVYHALLLKFSQELVRRWMKLNASVG